MAMLDAAWLIPALPAIAFFLIVFWKEIEVLVNHIRQLS